MTKDRTTGMVAFILGLIIAFLTKQLPPSTMAGDIGPKVFPYISAGLLIVCGIGLLVTGNKKTEAFFTREQGKRLGVIFAVVLGYVIIMQYAGFLVPTFFVLIVLCSMFSEGKSIACWKRILFAMAVTAVIYYLFTLVLSLRLPQGKLF